MAKFKYNGIDGISASLQELSRLSDDEKLDILRPAGALLLGKLTDAIRTSFKQRSGKLAESLKAKEVVSDGTPMITIAPTGNHPSSSTGKRRRKGKDEKSHGKYSGSNAEILYILEYGSPRIPARHIIEDTLDQAEDEIMDSIEAAWDDLLKQKGL